MGFLQIYYRCSPPPPLHLQHTEQDSSAPRFSFLIRQPSTQYASGKLLPIRDEVVLFANTNLKTAFVFPLTNPVLNNGIQNIHIFICKNILNQLCGHALVRSIIYLLCFFSRRKAKLNVFQRSIAQETFY